VSCAEPPGACRRCAVSHAPGHGLQREAEAGQLVSESSHELRMPLSALRGSGTSWTLRLFAILVSLMVIYTFIDQPR
jgi:hypothetical protein